MPSKKGSLAAELNLATPPARPARANVRDHIESQEDDGRASYASDRRLQQRRPLKTVFFAILGTAQFSTFSTASASCPTSRFPRQRAGRKHRESPEAPYRPGRRTVPSFRMPPSGALGIPRQVQPFRNRHRSIENAPTRAEHDGSYLILPVCPGEQWATRTSTVRVAIVQPHARL
jgi:hypothetical protein